MLRLNLVEILAISLIGLMQPALAGDLPPLSHSLEAHDPREAAAALRLKDIGGRTVDLSTYKGKIVLINYWATWCPPCRREMPSIEHLVEKIRSKDFVVLAVDVGEDADTIETFTSQLDTPLSFPILLDTDSKAMQSWRVAGLPTTYFIDRRGRVAYTAIGGREFDHPDIERTVRTLLKP